MKGTYKKPPLESEGLVHREESAHNPMLPEFAKNFEQ